WPDQPVIDANNPRVEHQVGRVEDRVEVVTRVGQRTFRAVVEYALGSRHQGQSFLARDPAGQVRELRLARYPRAPEWDTTMEHPPVPTDPDGYLGRPLSAESFRKCLHCHATHFRAAREPGAGPEGRDHGIGCERCHGPGGHHLLAIAAHLPEPAIARPRLAAPAAGGALCAQCHPAPVALTPPPPGFVRLHAPRLVRRRCVTETTGALPC